MRYRVVTMTMRADVDSLVRAIQIADGRPAVVFLSTSFGVWEPKPFLTLQGDP